MSTKENEKLRGLLQLKDTEISILAKEINRLEALVNQLDTVLAKVPGHVYWLDKNNVFLGCNENQAQHAKLISRKAIVGKTNYDMPWKDQADALNRANIEVMKTGIAKVFEENAQMSFGSGVFLSEKAPLRDKAGQIVGTLGISLDITEMKRKEKELRIAKEQAEEANRAKTEFMEMMTHELRTPLTAILGNLHNLMQHPEDSIEKHLQNFKNMKISGEQLLGHINDILDYAQMRKGQFNLHPEQFDFGDVIQASIALLSASAKSKNLALVLDYPSELPRSFYADKDRISQVLFNLIGNAIKFTRKGQVGIKISCLSQSKDKVKMKISISDTGCGIPADKQEKIFEKFEQLNTGQQKQGTGLGLAIVKEIIDKFQGQIEVESIVGKGSTFHICLPLALKASPKEAKLPNQNLNFNHENSIGNKVPRKKSSKKSRHVLIVEDNLINQAVIEDMLKDLKCETKSASSAKEALLLFDQHVFDLILMDINLPDMNGYELTQMIRKKSVDQPIVALTANASEAIAIRCKENGMNGMLGKPINPTHLSSIIQDWLGKLRE